MDNPAIRPNPPARFRARRMPLKRVKDQPVQGYSTCHRPLGLLTHYWNGQTTPHSDRPPCKACDAGVGTRWKGYVTLYDPETKEHWIQEYTPTAHELIEHGLRTYGTIHGHLLCFRRTGTKPNSPMRADVYLGKIPPEELPAPIDILACLYRIWLVDGTPPPQPLEPPPYNTLAPLHPEYDNDPQPSKPRSSDDGERNPNP